MRLLNERLTKPSRSCLNITGTWALHTAQMISCWNLKHNQLGVLDK